MTNPSILITGAAGFAGRHLLAHLQATHSTRLIAWSHRSLQVDHTEGVEWQQVDITDRDAVIRGVADAQPDRVIHLAGSPHVGQSWVDSWMPLKTNVMGTHHLLRAIHAHVPRCRVLVVTSAMVYRPTGEPLNEDSTMGPSSPYGFSKLAQDQLALAAAREDGLDVVVARPFNHAGPGQDSAFFLSSFAKQIALIEAGQSAAEIRVGNIEPERDLTDVRDVVEAYAHILAGGAAGQAYNVCSGRTHRIGDVLDRLIALSCVPVTPVTDPERFRPNDAPRLVGNSARLRTELGWRPHRTIDETIADTLDHWRSEIAAGRVTD